ncbi:SpaA isopeptide-forming pilin-related protein [Corynebacterium aquilae]|uniref:SpaA isopeptide-forming pilin-related protein n=1 Tax=Corynebacterium aquilae TaxID=203263 RepID=UPI000952C66A|nr:SpaA isopeptide-forming pilin-related protein [Corynebacterium aquilae]
MATTPTRDVIGVTTRGVERVKRQPNSTLRALLAWLAVIILSIATAAIPQAHAYIADESITQPAVDGQPQLHAEMTHSKVDGHEPRQGEEFTYTATFTVDNAYPAGIGTELSITVAQDPNAPFSSPPEAGDLSAPGGTITGITANPGGSWTYTVTVKTPGSFSATFTKQAQVKSSAPAGTAIIGSASIAAKPAGVVDVAIVQDDPHIDFDEGRCAGVAEFSATVPADHLGSWLADIKFALNPAKARFAPLPSKDDYFAGTDPNNSITFTGLSSQQLQTIKDAAVINRSDTTPPLYGTDPKLQKPGVGFVDSINWPYNPAIFTGTAWIPTNVHVVIKRPFSYLDCIPVQTTLGPNPDRLNSMGVQFSNGRAFVDDRTATTDAFVLPGGTTPTPSSWCQDIYYTQLPSNNGGTALTGPINKFHVTQSTDPDNPNPNATAPQTVVSSLTEDYGGLALSPYLPDKIFFFSNGNLQYIDNGSITTIGPAPQYTLSSIAFDPSGTLWHVSAYGQVWHWKQDPTTHLPTGPAIKGPQLPLNGNSYVQDIAFLDDGSLVYGMNYGNTFSVYTVPAKELTGTKAPQTQLWGTYPFNGPAWGFAFGPDKRLYVAPGVNANNPPTTVWEIPKDGQAIRVNFGFNLPGFIGGLSSCDFGAPLKPQGAFTVAKSAVDPVTGTVAPAGTTAPNTVTFDSAHRATVSYIITVTNSTDQPVDAGTITDTMTVPQGFTILSKKAEEIGGSPIDNFPENGTLNPGTMPPNSIKQYRITLEVQATVDALAAKNNLECETSGAGTPGTGLFNLVTSPEDKDGADNNDACIPITPVDKAHLTLIKKIVDQSGTPLPDQSDAQNFQLVGSLQSPTLNTGVAGTANPDTGIAVDEDVIAGTYTLAEQGPTVDGDAPYYYQAATWTCSPGTFDPATSSVTVPTGATATCTVTNTKVPKFHVEKLATHPAATDEGTPPNPHIGAPVILNDGRGTIEYTIVVSNDATFAGNSGPITDRFGVPAGLVWDSTRQATVTFNGEHGSTATDLLTHPTEQQLASGATIASSVRNIPGLSPGATSGAANSASFTIAIPIAADGTKNAGGTTAFEQAEKTLGECTSTTVENTPVADGTTNNGVLNHVYLPNEYTNDTKTLWNKDNVACVPVRENNIHVVKQATHHDGTSGVHEGEMVSLKAPAPGQDPAGVLDYTIIVSNDAPFTATTGPLSDTFTMPPGLTSNGDATITLEAPTGVTVTGAPTTVPINPTGETTVNLAEAISGLAARDEDGHQVTFTISIPVKATADFSRHADDLNSCVMRKLTSADGKESLNIVSPDSTDGAINATTLTGETGAYTTIPDAVEGDNKACIPVELLLPKWNLKKYADNSGEANNDGTEFTANPGVKGEEKTLTFNPNTGRYETLVWFKVTQSNDGDGAGPAPAVTDTITLPEGMRIDAVTAGEKVQTLTPQPLAADTTNTFTFTIPAGDTPIDPGQTRTYLVRVAASVDVATANSMNWGNALGETSRSADATLGAGECQNEGAGTPGTGIFNQVSADGDDGSDGDNDACVPVRPSAKRILVEKTDDTGKTRLTGAQFALYKATFADGGWVPETTPLLEALPALDSQTAPSVLPGFNPDTATEEDFNGRFITPQLAVGQVYLLKETKSPAMDGKTYSLLPEPVMFKVESDGSIIPVNSLGDESTDGVEKQDGTYVVGNSFYLAAGTITVHDPRVGELPKAGGVGHWTLAAGAWLLIAASLVSLYRAGSTRRRAL